VPLRSTVAVGPMGAQVWRELRHQDEAPGATLEDHLTAALSWLEAAHERTGRRGVSYGFSLRGGWLPAYRETSGYITTTFLRAAGQLDRPDLAERALQIADWLLDVQNDDGSFANPKYGESGIVFDTGQDLFGLVGAYRRTGQERYLDGARRAGDWLAAAADGQLLWTRHEHRNTPHVYNTRTAWALLQLHRVEPAQRWLDVAVANLDWAVRNQVPGGYFANNAFERGDDPYTHNISYAVCGLQESGWLLGEDRYVTAARRCSDAVRAVMRDDGFIPGQISVQGVAERRYSCLTGQAQLAGAWAKQFDRSGEPHLQEASRRSLDFVLRRHRTSGGSSHSRGAVAGSSPLWGRYAPFSYPNWAAKFLVDACLLQRAWQVR
jgi:hypothetical protein